MSLADILNTDVEVVGAKLREGVSWWLDELRAIAAPLIERRRKRRPSLAAERRGDGQYILQRPGQPEEPYAPGRSRLAVALILPATMVLVRSISGLFLSERDIRRMIALDLDRLTPFRAEAVYQSVAIEPIDKEKTERHARLGVAPRSSVDQLLTDAKAAGLDPVAVIIPDAYAWLDLAPDSRTAGVALGRSSPVGRLWLAIGLMFALNLGMAIWRDAQATERLRNAVAIQQPLIERIEQMRRELINRQTEDKAQRTARVSGEPLRVLDALSRTLPEEAWVQRLSWDGATVRLAGLRRDGVDVISALRREQILKDVRNADPAAEASSDSFDVLAAVEAPEPSGSPNR